MIDISLKTDDKSFDLFVNGHAGYGKKGQDIVCAAVSALVQTLAACLDKMSSYYDVDYDENGVIKHIGATGKNAAIACEVIMYGLNKIAFSYPENVSISADRYE